MENKMPMEEIEVTDLPEELRCEVNLLIYPFFALTSKDVAKREKTEFRTITEREGKKIEISWKVSPNVEYGYPGPFAKRIHRGIEEIIKDRGFPVENPIQFSIYELCKKVGLHIGGSQYDRVRNALKSIQFTSIDSEGAFYYKGKKKWINKTFSLYETIIFKGEELDSGEVAEATYLYLNNLYLKSLNAHYVRPLNFDYYKRLKTNVAKRLYELLGVKFYGLLKSNQKGGKRLRYKYSTLCDSLPLTSQKYLSKAKKILRPAHQELKETNFLDGVLWEEMEGIKRDWYLYYYPGSRAKKEVQMFNSSLRFSGLVETEKEEEEIENLIDKIVKVVGKRDQNEGFYYTIARRCPEKVINIALKDTQMAERSGEIKKSKTAFFGYWIKELCEEREIDLGLKPSTYVREKRELKEEGDDKADNSGESDFSGSDREMERQDPEQSLLEAEVEEGEGEVQFEVEENGQAKGVDEDQKEQLMEHYRSLSEEKQEHINKRAMENLGDFAKGQAKKLENKGKDPLEESVAVRAIFKDERFKILKKEMDGKD